jgi:hypothetical protein
MKSFLLFVFLSSGILQDNFYSELSEAAVFRTTQPVAYDGSYFAIGYPNGDIPSDKGVCTDLVIRSYRRIGIDLQQKVHEDMMANFHLYPKNWGLNGPDKNIDHRRVPNLMKFFSRFGEVKEITNNPNDYNFGDIVTWNLGAGITHIGIIINKKSTDGKRSLVAHNIGRGPEISDCLFDFEITGHYRYRGK